MADVLVMDEDGQVATGNADLTDWLWHKKRSLAALADLWDLVPGSDEHTSPGLGLVRRQLRYGDIAAARRKLDAMALHGPEAFNLNGIVYELTGEYLKAFLAYREALKARPGHVAAQMNLRRCLELETYGESSIPLFL
jgi:Flp pilus assembly protein TadD